MDIGSLLAVLFRIVPTSRRRVFFKSFDGLYNDNPRYISECLHHQYPDVKIYWAKSERSKEVFPPYIHIVPNHGVRYFYYLNRCRVVVENGAGVHYAFVDNFKRKKIYSILYRRKTRFDIATWHGTPLKKIGYDTLWDKGKKFFTTADILVAGSEYEKIVFASAFKDAIPLLVFGNARNDILCEKLPSKDVDGIKAKLGVPTNNRIVLYAPTYRETVLKTNSEHNYDYLMNLDVDNLVCVLENTFGGSKWSFVFRGHQMIQDYINQGGFNKYKTQIVNGNLHDDMAEYLSIADVLITDFSGSLFDFALTGKPCFLYAPDFDDYVNHSHGVYKIIDSLPYSISLNNEGLFKCIKSFDRNVYANMIKKFIDINGFVTDGKGAERVVELIMRKLEK